MMSTAGTMRPPMSNVRATPAPAPGIVLNVCADPAATRLLAEQPEPEGGGVVDPGSGVTPGSPFTIRTQPGSITPGFVTSDGYASPFQAWSCWAVVPWARAIADSESPG